MVEDPAVARQLADHVATLRSDTRLRLFESSWQWLPVWAAVCLGASISTLGAQWVAEWYWPVAATVGLVATGYIGRRLDSVSDVQTRSWPYWAVGAGIGFANFGGSAVFSEEVIVVWIWVVLGLGFAALCHLDSYDTGRNVMGGLAVASAIGGLLVSDTFKLYSVLGVVFAFALAGVAIHAHRSTRPAKATSVMAGHPSL